MPNCITIRRAMPVARSMSLPAPVVIFSGPNTSSSAARPASPSAFALGSGARFVARGIDVNKYLPDVLKAAHRHKGAPFNIKVALSLPGAEINVHSERTDDAAHADVYVAVRDGRWATIPMQILEQTVEASEDAFSVDLLADTGFRLEQARSQLELGRVLRRRRARHRATEALTEALPLVPAAAGVILYLAARLSRFVCDLNRHPDDYRLVYEGREFTLGPHLVIGQGSGASNCGRIYLVFHEGDETTPRSVLVGHLTRHLPDSTT